MASVLLAAASTRLAEALEAPPRPAGLLAAFPAAVYLTLGEGQVVGVLTCDAVRLPFGMVLPTSSHDTPLDRCTGPAYVGDCSVVLGGVAVRWARWWQPPQPRPPRHVADGQSQSPRPPAGLDRHLPAGVKAAADELLAALTCTDLPAARAAADRLVGLGPGLTPAGDDILAGLLLGAPLLRPALPDRWVARFAQHVARRATRATTALSAALIVAAADGTGCPEAVALVNALGGHGNVPAALARLAALGHTSGRDLACGIAAAARIGARKRVLQEEEV